MALDLLKRVFARKKSSLATGDKTAVENPNNLIVTEPYSMGLQSINDGFFRALFPSSTGSTEQVSKIGARAITKVQKSLRGPQQANMIPRLPSVIPRLLRSLRDPSSGALDYVSIINKDPAMSAAVLKLANTVYFNPGSKRITAIDTAVVKLGIEGLRSVLSAAVMQPVIQRESAYFHRFGEQLWQHSLQCAVACERIAVIRGVEPYKAYLLGLIHDIGTITAFGELCRELKDSSSNEIPGFDVFTPFLQNHAPSLSEQIAQQWEFPEALCSALHQQVNIQAGDKVNIYGQILYQANLVCEVLAASEFHPPKAVEKLLRALDLPESLHAELNSLSVEV